MQHTLHERKDPQTLPNSSLTLTAEDPAVVSQNIHGAVPSVETETSLSQPTPQKVLAIWSSCCEEAGINWYLYSDTLLCANGYDRFPDTLKHAQVAVLSTDLCAVKNKIYYMLPGNWEMDTYLFSISKNTISFKQNHSVILDVHVLSPLETPEQAEIFSSDMRELRASYRRKIKLLKLLNRLSLRIFKKPVKRVCHSIAKKSFEALRSLAIAKQENPLYYCDNLTSKLGVVFPAALLSETEYLICGDTSYPAFSGYRTYLENVYGDYETGLVDEVGVGLSVPEKAELKAHQARCREALAFVQQLSEEFGLRYYLLAGSVLGCVRHGGFIPWDDDIDLGIRIEDLEHFEAVVKEHLPTRLPEGFSLVQSGPDNGYPRMFSKICYEGRCCMDLWPLVPTYTDGFRAKITWYFAKIITKVHYKKLGKEPTRFVKIVNFMSLFMTDKMVLWFARLNERKFQKRNTPAYINLYSIYRREKETIPRHWLDEKATANFEGLNVPVVGCTEEYLTHLYGNYMAKPAPWKRASRHTARFASPESNAED